MTDSIVEELTFDILYHPTTKNHLV